MNCVCPIAPAHEPRMTDGSMSPSSRMTQRREQFVTEIVALKADIGEACESPNDIVRADKTAKIRLQPPDAQDHGVVDAKDLFRSCEPEAFRARSVATALDAVGRYGARDVVPNRTHEFGLRFRASHNFGIECDAGEGFVKDSARDPALLGERAKAHQRIRESLADEAGRICCRPRSRKMRRQTIQARQ